MKHPKSAFAVLAAAGLLAAQPASAAFEARSATPVAESEQLAGGIPSAAWPAIIAILAVADQKEVRDIAEVRLEIDHRQDLTLLFDPGHSLDERIVSEQFVA